MSAQWCTPIDVSTWAPEFAVNGGLGGFSADEWDRMIQAATWYVIQKIENRYGAIVVDPLNVPEALNRYTSVVAARIAMQVENTGTTDSRIKELRLEQTRFNTRAASGSLTGLSPTYSDQPAPKVYGIGTTVGETLEQRKTIYQLCRGPGPFGVEKFND